MRKSECIQQWLDDNFIQGTSIRELMAQLSKDRNGKLAIAAALIIPYSRRLEAAKLKIENGSSCLGYSTSVEEVILELDFMTSYLDGFLSTLYKKDHLLSDIKPLIAILNEARNLQERITNDNLPCSRNAQCSSNVD